MLLQQSNFPDEQICLAPSASSVARQNCDNRIASGQGPDITLGQSKALQRRDATQWSGRSEMKGVDHLKSTAVLFALIFPLKRKQMPSRDHVFLFLGNRKARGTKSAP